MLPHTDATPGARLLEMLPRSPDAYPQKLDLVRDAALFVRLDADAYRAASFLDDRVLGPGIEGAWLPLDTVRAAARRATNLRPLHFIFHTGHVGSTLLSRLLDDTEGVLSLREPTPLRTLADACDDLGRPESLLSGERFDADLATFLTLWRRGYDATRCVVLKATSVAGRMAGPILRSQPESKAIYLNLRAEPYLATLLAGANSSLDLRGHGPGRIRRLQAQVAARLQPIHALTLGQLAAMSWVVETLTQHDALAQHPGQVLALDFDRLLANVEECGRVALAHFGLPHDAQQLSQLARSPALVRYAKAPEYAYSPADRAEILARSRRANREEIGRGMAWLERLAQSDDGVAALLSRTEQPSASYVVG